ncbi:ropporin-1-like protein [Megalopta genalis]|uniref:ropporin-1-like protein n=1 Tax=Megalopta genalis TaxID=115081 RepID=UPI003FD57C33
MTFEFARDIDTRSSRVAGRLPCPSNMSDDALFCAEQIKIPPTFPDILRLYMKAAIRTQPYDLLRWTCAYFRALANGELPPVKKRLEYPPFVHPTSITPGYLRTLLNTFGPIETVGMVALLEKWQGIALPEYSLYQILLVGQLTSERECDFFKFLAIACGFLGKVSRLARE